MLTDTPAVVLKAVRYSDTNSIVHTYTEQFGSTSYLVSRSSGRKSGASRALFLPLSILQLTTDHRPNKDIQRIREATILHIPTRPSIDPVANAIALFIAELLDRILRAGERDPSLFQFISDEIRHMGHVDGQSLASFHLYFMGELSWRLGIMPDTEGYRQGDILCCNEGRFRPAMSRQEAELAEASYLFHQLLTVARREALSIGRDGRNKLLSLLLHYFDHHFPGIAHLKSPGVLQELFA
ncbi:DNA repair protein RecO [Porphyromonas sp.]|uniref:DNA repair protein RecO n=1 Tax=Porphyromonas sp. TaxID=1924944 RepID=UPI0026DC955B|nr:recombination protein O N-terminal domain-containing protein [Porphyromonas sp.]MDO4771847.1 recombination protein O N-terminal domain-containing protein [Porphyromonas sp.]